VCALAIVVGIGTRNGRAQETDYAPRAVFYSDGRVTRFEKNPVTIRLGPLPENLTDSGFDDEFRKAVELWETATDGLVRCVFVGDEVEKPDIPVSWVTKIPGRSQETHLGKTVLTRDTETAYHITMELGVYDTTTGRLLTREKMLSVCLHELGHAFGLWGHSDVADDVMSPSTEATAPTARDVATMKRLYALPQDAPLHELAMEALRADLEREPSNVDYQFLLGNLLLDAKRYDEAVDRFLQVLTLDARHQDAAERLVRAHLELGKAKEALQEIERSSDPSPEFYNNAARIFYDRGEIHEAIQSLERAVRLDPRFEVAKRNLGRLYAREADRLADIGDLAGAETLMRRATETIPSETGYRMRLGVLLDQLGKSADALAVLNDIVRQEPGNAVARQVLAKAYNNAGVEATTHERWKEAVDAFEEALRHDPSLETARANRAAALWKWGIAVEATDIPRSSGIFERFLDVEPGSVAGHVRVGVLYAQLSDFPHAIAAFERARQLDPNDPIIIKNLIVTHHQYGVNLDKTGHLDAAIEQFRQGLALDADYLDLYRSLGQTYARMGRHEDALGAYAEILKRSPTDAWAQSSVVNVYLAAGNEAFQKGRLQEAIARFESVPDTSRTAAVYAMLGYLYLTTDRPVKAVDGLGRALLLDPRSKTNRANFDLANKRLQKANRDKPSAETQAAVVRAEAYDLAARIATRPKKADVARFSELVASAPTDAVTTAALQDCALVVARSANTRYPADAETAARNALRLNPSHAELRAWVNGIAQPVTDTP
jgi:tetratricopeptide (TPR) repeat protein